MAQFQVPQFIETEAKIVGPLTLRQFGYLGGTGLLAFVLFFILRTGIWVVVTIFLGLTAAALAFFKYNGRPLPSILKNFLLYMLKPKLYLWERVQTTQKPTSQIPQVKETPTSKIKNTWLNLVTKKGPPNKVQ